MSPMINIFMNFGELWCQERVWADRQDYFDLLSTSQKSQLACLECILCKATVIIGLFIRTDGVT